MSQLAVPNRDVVVPLLVAHGVDKKLLSGENYQKEYYTDTQGNFPKKGKNLALWPQVLQKFPGF